MSSMGSSFSSSCNCGVVFSTRHSSMSSRQAALVSFDLISNRDLYSSRPLIYRRPPSALGLPETFQRVPLCCSKFSFRKVLLNCCELTYSPQLSPIDDNFDEVGLGGRDAFPSDRRINHRTHHRSVAVAVQEIQRLVTVQPLVFIDVVHRDVQRTFRTLRNREEGRRTAKADAHLRILLAVNNQFCRHLDIRGLEGRQLLLPVVVLKLQIQRP